MTISHSAPSRRESRRHRLGMLTHCGSQPIETVRLLLRPFAPADAEAMYKNWSGDSRVTQFLLWRAHADLDETRSVLRYWEKRYRSKDFYEWAIVPRDLGEPIGSIGAVKAKGKLTWEIGYCIGVPWWGQGICTEALAAVMGYMFREVGCRTLIAMHALENPASGRVMEKCGMLRRPGDSVPISTENGLFNCRVYELGRSEFDKLCAIF